MNCTIYVYTILLNYNCFGEKTMTVSWLMRGPQCMGAFLQDSHEKFMSTLVPSMIKVEFNHVEFGSLISRLICQVSK